jgi:hypothetical protein
LDKAGVFLAFLFTEFLESPAFLDAYKAASYIFFSSYAHLALFFLTLTSAHFSLSIDAKISESRENFGGVYFV